MSVRPCWTCKQPATHTLTRDGSIPLDACDNCTRIDRTEAESRGWTIVPLRPAPVTLTKTAVTLHDIETNTVWRRMDHSAGEHELALCRSLGDTIQEYETTDRDGNPLRVVLQIDAPREYAEPDQGGVYEFAR